MTSTGGEGPRIAYDFAVLRVVPHPHLERWSPVGVVLHARTEAFLDARVVEDVVRLQQLAPEVDVGVLVRYLRNWRAIAQGREDAGPVALYPPSERFHWLTCPRSDVLQSSPVRRGVTSDPARALDRIWREQVASNSEIP
ncbi:MAG: DUF3037 domain-containing protein [Gemmatimonadales bacterium]|jgi:hypothetical protein|nr:MAG: DUF3037 domain-containing protein [Gemmatimonadales bacterium]